MRTTLLGITAVAALAGCAAGVQPARASRPPASTPPAPTFDPAAPPPAMASAIARGDAAIAELQRRLSARLGAALRDGGPPAAVSVCRDEAPRITASIRDEQGISIGRTSDRLRNPRNAAPPWAREIVAASAAHPAAAVRPVAVDLGDRVGLLRPIAVAQACTRCHGVREDMAPDVRARLAREYPDDRAMGYAAGDHRGFFWVEVPR